LRKPVIVWFRRNLRLADNAPLDAAARSGQPVICVYIHDGEPLGGASKWWLHHSLVRLRQNLETIGAPLIIRRADPVDELGRLAATTGATLLCYSRRCEPDARAVEARLERALGDSLEIRACDDELLLPPQSLATKTGRPYRVFTPFWRAATAAVEPPPIPRPAPKRLSVPDFSLQTLAVDDLDLLPRAPDWSHGLRESWTPGENGALARLERVVSNAPDYDNLRDRPDLDGTSRLSPALHFGELGPRQVWHALRPAMRTPEEHHGVDALVRQLYWREFSHYLLYHFPTLPNKPLRPEFESFPWIEDEALLDAWQRGRTGYPIIDAGMRQLWLSGWMHNRVRMIVASFLVKNLLVPWQHGAAWFLDTLVDADLANNSAGWQWVAGCGADAAPYFRIFNPVLQGKKFDPQGHYVRHWLPELAGLPDEHVHEPWLADGLTLELAGLKPGVDYPLPIVDLKPSRERALAAYDALRGLLQSAAVSPGSSAG
jgi:deoxyribodipyrimidine photo-lyase